MCHQQCKGCTYYVSILYHLPAPPSLAYVLHTFVKVNSSQKCVNFL